MLLSSVVSSNVTDLEFDGINIFDGLRRISEYFREIPNHLPSFQRVGLVMGKMLSCFPPRFWFCMIIFVIGLVLVRILRRF